MAEDMMNAFNSYKDGLKDCSEFFTAFNGKNNFQEEVSMKEALGILSKSEASGIGIYDTLLKDLHDLFHDLQKSD